MPALPAFAAHFALFCKTDIYRIPLQTPELQRRVLQETVPLAPFPMSNDTKRPVKVKLFIHDFKALIKKC